LLNNKINLIKRSLTGLPKFMACRHVMLFPMTSLNLSHAHLADTGMKRKVSGRAIIKLTHSGDIQGTSEP